MTDAIAPALHRIGRRIQAAGLVAALGHTLAPVLALALAACLADHLAHLPAALRLVAALGCLILLGRGVVVHLWPLRRISAERTALAVEAALGREDNALINAYQFSSMTGIERSLVGGTVTNARLALATPPWGRLLHLGSLGWWLGGVLAAAVAWGGYAQFWPDHADNTFARLTRPLADIPPLGNVLITLTPEQRISVAEGATVTITVRLAAVDRGTLDPGLTPVLVRGEGLTAPAESVDGAETVALTRTAEGTWQAVLPEVRRALSLRALAAGSWSRSLAVAVVPPPRLTTARFIVSGPEYVGLDPVELPGPPAQLTVLPGAQVQLAVVCEPAVAAARWILPGAEVDLADGSATARVTSAGAYRLEVPARDGAPALVIARGEVVLDRDAAPTASLRGGEANRFVTPGSVIPLSVTAQDDRGLQDMVIRVHDSADEASTREVKAWRYRGPPGLRAAAETYELTIDPTVFLGGHSYIVQAVARDRHPLADGQEGRSAPMVLRVRAATELSLADGDPRGAAFALLKQCLAEQVRARGVSANARANLDDLRRLKTLGKQGVAIADSQEVARVSGAKAAAAFDALRDGPTVAILAPLIGTLMPGVRDAVRTLANAADPEALLSSTVARQDDAIARLTALLGSLADQRPSPERTVTSSTNADQAQDRARISALADGLDRFIADQERILERSRTLAAAGNADLTDADHAILGDLAASEHAWAKFLEEKLTDFSKNPPQDFSDASQSGEFNVVWQDIKLAADALDGKNVEIAVPKEQMGIENAKELVNNLEKWLSDAPDKFKWLQEDTAQPADVAVVELPKELEDIVGDLLDQEEAMTEDIQDVTSQWMDSIDKGAGWTAVDGPISNMSAKGITGNVLPNQNEVGGRSGEGRNGRSSGQMVQDEAVGKGGQETPTRLDQTPFERGSVKDSSRESGGGATGGGKRSGFDQEGLRGPTPPPAIEQALQRLAGKQQLIRQQAEALALTLRAQRLPSGDVETAIEAMASVEAAAARFDIRAIRTAHTAALDTLGEARQTVAATTRLQQERSRLPKRLRQDLSQASSERVPAGYEEMVGSYFQALAGQAP